MSNTDTDRTKSPEELELEKQAAIAKLKNDIAKGQADTQKAIAEADKATLQAQKDQVKGPEVTALAGNITSDGTFIESRILARKTLRAAFAALGESLKNSTVFKNKSDIRLVLYNAADLPAIESYMGLRTQLSVLEKDYAAANAHAKELLKAAAAAATGTPTPPASEAPPVLEKKSAFESYTDGPHLPAVPAMAAVAAFAAGPAVAAGYAGAAILRTAVDLASLFRVNTDLKNFELLIDDTALAAEFKAAIPTGWQLWHPSLFPVNTLGQLDASSAFLSLLEKVEEKNKEAGGLLAKINDKITQLTGDWTKETEPAKKQAIQGRLDGFSAGLNPINTLNNAFTQLLGLLFAVDATTHLTALTTVLRAERLIGLLKGDHTYFVKLAAVSKGSNKVSQRLWSSAVIRHSAGTELNCLVFAPDGEIVFSNTQLKYTPYVKSDEIK